MVGERDGRVQDGMNGFGGFLGRLGDNVWEMELVGSVLAPGGGETLRFRMPFYGGAIIVSQELTDAFAAARESFQEVLA